MKNKITYRIAINPCPKEDPLWILANAPRGIRHISLDALLPYLQARLVGGVCMAVEEKDPP